VGRIELLGLAAFVPELFVLDAAGSRFREGVRVDIAYQAGVDLDLKVTRPVSFSDDATREAPAVRSLPASFADMARTLPIRTAGGQPPRPADLMNLVFVGPADVLADAFRRAGWSTADRLNARDDVKAFLAIASREGYRTAPVSLETVDGRVPDAVFQKQTNTFAKRHHVRIWRQGSWAGQPLWVAAGTHDIGVKFDAAEHSFTHRVQQQVDVERDKIANDLAFAGVMPAAYVDRPNAPRSVQNATGDGMRTDGRLAVLFLADSN
jgi:LssY C-terminus